MRGFINGRRVAFTLLSFIFLSSAFSEGTSEEKPIRIGVAGPYTGEFAPYGIATLRATELVVEAVNEQGGILGHRIEVISGDDQCAPDQAVNIAAKMIESDVVGVVGHICSGSTIAAQDVYRQEGIPVISPSAAEPNITLSGNNPTFFRTIPHNGVYSKVQVEFLNSLGIRTLAILHDKGDYGRSLAEFIRTEAEKTGIEVLLFEGITPGVLDYSAIILKIAGLNPEMIAFGGYHPEAARLLAQINMQGLGAGFIAGSGIYDLTFLNIAKEDAEGVYVVAPIDNSDKPQGKKAYEHHVQKFHEAPGPWYQSGYAAAQVLIAAIDRAKSVDGEAISSVLKSQSFQTSLGEISFDEIGDIQAEGFVGMFQVQDGKFVRVY